MLGLVVLWFEALRFAGLVFCLVPFLRFSSLSSSEHQKKKKHKEDIFGKIMTQ